MARGIFGLDRVYKKQVQNIKDDNFESWPESSTYGYFAGGVVVFGPGGQVNTIDRLDLFTEATSAPGNNLPQVKQGMAAVSSSSYGYFGGGFFNPPSSVLDTIDRFDFSNETTSAPGNNLTQGRESLSAASN